MRRTSSLLGVLTSLVLLALPTVSVACSYPEPPTFREAIESASNIVIFRLESAEVKRKDFSKSSYSEWIEGKIRVTQTLRGDSSRLRTIEFSTSWCGGLRLDVGHYFLVLTNDTGPTISLAPSDPSILDITRWYDESRPEVSAGTDLLSPIFSYLSGEPLPTDFPPGPVADYTSSIPPPPPPPPATLDSR